MTLRKNVLIGSLALGLANPVLADMDWVSVTLDNDLFVGNDNGYTNGLYVSFFDTGDVDRKIPDHDFWVSPLMWSMPKTGVDGAANAYMIGQTMSTPSDIKIAEPGENEMPYSALLALTNSYVTATPDYADRVSTTIGWVGPSALGEEAQKFVHDIIGAEEPQGWDTQLRDELVFQLSRARTWRKWVSDSGHYDFLSNAEVAIGTIQSNVSAGMTFRYGRGLENSFAPPLFNSSRVTNPSAVDNGWYVYGGAQAGYIFNQIFTDGNTFKDSRSIDYDHEFIGITAGFAYAWQNFTLTFAINDANVIQSGDTEKELENLSQYGTLSLAWRL